MVKEEILSDSEDINFKMLAFSQFLLMMGPSFMKLMKISAVSAMWSICSLIKHRKFYIKPPVKTLPMCVIFENFKTSAKQRSMEILF